jgi:hypothetical protein
LACLANGVVAASNATMMKNRVCAMAVLLMLNLVWQNDAHGPSLLFISAGSAVTVFIFLSLGSRS